MKKISFIVVAMAVCAFAAEYGVKLAASGACVRACGTPVVAFSMPELLQFQRLTGPRLTGNNLYCAINLVGRSCLDRMRERRMNDRKAFRIQRNGKSKKESDYIAIDYLGCLMGQYNPQIEPCIYKE